MRVVHVTTVHNPRDTRILYRECSSLARAGFDTRLIACADNAFECNGVQVLALPKSSTRLERMTRTAFRAFVTAWRQNADVYHFHDPELIPWMAVLRLKTRNIIFDVHENVRANVEDRPWIPKALRPLFRAGINMLIPVIGNLFNLIFAEDSYPKEYGVTSRYSIVRNFPDQSVFCGENGEAKKSRFTVAYIGSISEHRGAVDLCDAVAILQRNNVDVGLLIIGRDDLGGDQSIEDLIAGRSLTNVEHYSYTPQPEAMKMLMQCHVGLAVLHPVRNYVDSYPTKVFEYMGCGLAVIASNFPLYKNVVEVNGCGITIEPGNAAVLAKAILELMRDGEAVKRMGLRGREAVDMRYNWTNEERTLLGIYQRMKESS